MSEVITDKLTGRATAGDVTITSEGGSATMQLQQGVCKAWARYSHANTQSEDSINIASATDQGVGDAKLTFTNAMGNNDFACNVTVSNNESRNSVFNGPSTTTVDIEAFGTTDANTDAAQGVTIHGDLA